MLIAFANNQTLTAIHGINTVITTDPVPMGGADTIKVITNVHSLISQNGAALNLLVKSQISNDGATWVYSGVSESIASTGPTPSDAANTDGGYVRFEFTFSVTGNVDEMGSITFDCHARIFKV